MRWQLAVQLALHRADHLAIHASAGVDHPDNENKLKRLNAFVLKMIGHNGVTMENRISDDDDIEAAFEEPEQIQQIQGIKMAPTLYFSALN